MQYTGMTEMFGFIGEMMNKAFKPFANKFEHHAYYKGNRMVETFTKNNRPIKLIGFMGGTFVIGSGAVIINRKIQNNEIIPATSHANAYFSSQYNSTVGPRLQAAIDTAYQYAQNGNISLLDPHLDTIAEIVIEYPQYKKFVKYTKPMQFPMDTYFDAKQGGIPISTTSNIAQSSTEKLDNIKQAQSETEQKEEVILKSESHPDAKSMVLSMDKKDLQREMMSKLPAEDAMLKFENQLDYIRHVCVIRRCEKIYFRALRHANKGNVQECAQILAELWEYVVAYEMPVIIGNEDGETHKLEEEDLLNVMRICHEEYARYLIDTAARIGDKVDRTGVNKIMVNDMNKKLLNLVYRNLEKARVYAEKYGVFNEDVKAELQAVWKAKEQEFQLA